MAYSQQNPPPYYKQQLHRKIYHAKSQIGGIRYYVPDDIKRHNIKKRLEEEIKISIPEETPQVIKEREERHVVESEPFIPDTHNFRKKRINPEVVKIIEQLRTGELGVAEAAKLIRQEDIKQIKEERKRVESEIKELKHKSHLKKKKDETYTISILGSSTIFGAFGIKKPDLSRQDQLWLEKAQYYFINAEEKGIRVGSAAGYTTREILEALWATAVHEGINPKRFLVQLYTESRFNPNQVGKAGERGLGQFKKSTANFHKFNWDLLKGGNDTYAYQARSSAKFVKMVGESAYNSVGPKGKRYSSKINRRLMQINKTEIPSIAENCC